MTEREIDAQSNEGEHPFDYRFDEILDELEYSEHKLAGQPFNKDMIRNVIDRAIHQCLAYAAPRGMGNKDLWGLYKIGRGKLCTSRKLAGWNTFFQERFDEVEASGIQTFGMVSKEISRQWKALPADQRERYYAIAEQMKEPVKRKSKKETPASVLRKRLHDIMAELEATGRHGFYIFEANRRTFSGGTTDGGDYLHSLETIGLGERGFQDFLAAGSRDKLMAAFQTVVNNSKPEILPAGLPVSSFILPMALVSDSPESTGVTVQDTPPAATSSATMISQLPTKSLYPEEGIFNRVSLAEAKKMPRDKVRSLVSAEVREAFAGCFATSTHVKKAPAGSFEQTALLHDLDIQYPKTHFKSLASFTAAVKKGGTKKESLEILRMIRNGEFKVTKKKVLAPRK